MAHFYSRASGVRGRIACALPVPQRRIVNIPQKRAHIALGRVLLREKPVGIERPIVESNEKYIPQEGKDDSRLTGSPERKEANAVELKTPEFVYVGVLVGGYLCYIKEEVES